MDMKILLALAQVTSGLIENIERNGWWETIAGVYTSVIGEFFFAILFLLAPAMLYIKTQSVIPPAMAIIIGGATLASFFTSPIRFFFAIAAVFGVAIILYQVTRK